MGAITEGLTLSGFAGKYWYILVMIRWSIVSLILVALRDFSTFQIQLNLVFSWLFQIIIIWGKPLDNKFENRMLLFNEMMVSIYLFVLISLTDFNENEDLYDGCGVALLSIVMISFVVNFVKFLVFLIRDIYIRIKAKYCRERVVTRDYRDKEESGQEEDIRSQYLNQNNKHL